ncbi:hypothetical protein BDQ17DRAFT_1267556, partial [Cyathus striatus]
VPHAFQQKLSSEKTPTLSEALPSFQQMISVLKRYQDDMPMYCEIIKAGTNKLTHYYMCIVKVPAFKIAIHK